MGLEAVKDDILNSAKAQSSSLIAEARKEASRIMKEAERKAEAAREKSEAETKKMIDVIRRQELAAAELESKKLLLGAKKQVIENVFAEARARLEKLDDKKREDFIKKLLEKIKNEIHPEHIYCSKKDVKFVRGFGAEAAGMLGGLIAENKERTIRVDYSFDTILESLKERELQGINKMLFG